MKRKFGKTEAVARVQIADDLSRDLGGDLSSLHPAVVLTALRVVEGEALRQVIRAAKYPSHSTSIGTNAMARATGAAWAELHERVGYLIAELADGLGQAGQAVAS